MRITNQIQITPGGRHAWYMTDLGFRIRKETGDHVEKVIANSNSSR